MAGVKPRTSCLIKQVEILFVPCQYTRSLMNFIINKQEDFQKISSIWNINMRNKHHLHRPNTNVPCFQKR